MKNITKRIVRYSLMFLLIVSLIACKGNTVKNLDKIKIGIVDSTVLKKKSTIHWYDEDLEIVDTQILKYASMGDTFKRPTYEKDDVYFVPGGLQGDGTNRDVISINLRDFIVKEYLIDNISLTDVGVSDKYIFVNSNINFQAHLNRLDRKTKTLIQKTYDGTYFESILVFKDKLLVFGNMIQDETETFIYVLDEDFNILEIIDMSQYGRGGFKHLIDENDLYLSLPFDIDFNANNKLVKINMENYDIQVTEFDQDRPDTILEYKDQLLISHNDIINGTGTFITRLERKTGKFKSVDLKENLSYMDIYKGKLIVSDMENLMIFDIEDDFELIKKIKVNKNENNYISSIIITEREK